VVVLVDKKEGKNNASVGVAPFQMDTVSHIIVGLFLIWKQIFVNGLTMEGDPLVQCGNTITFFWLDFIDLLWNLYNVYSWAVGSSWNFFPFVIHI
jgi:hypothetical protein